MKCFTVLAILALVAFAASEEKSLLSRLFWSMDSTTKPTTRTTTQAATTTVGAATSGTSADSAQKGQVTPEMINQVLSLIDTTPQLQGHEDEIFNSEPQLSPDPFSLPLSAQPAQVQVLFKCLLDVVSKHPAGTPIDFNQAVSCPVLAESG